jgi:hypothetical protein
MFMSRICPQCSQINDDPISFCRRCGYRFQGDEQVISDEAAAQLANADPGATLRPGDQQAQPAQAAQPTPVVLTPQPQPQPVAVTPGAPAYAQPAVAPGPNQPQGGFAPPPAPQGAYQMPPAYGQHPYGAPAMVQAPSAASSLQRAFAGKGTPVHHQSWLLDGKQVPPATLRNSLIENVLKQGVMGVSAAPERLREQGVVLEERDFVKVQYGTSSVFVYMAPMGQNLYVSRISTVQQPFSRVRQFVLLSLFILLLICLLFYALINPSTTDLLSGNPGAYGFVDSMKTFFGYAFYGLLFFFLILLVRSLVYQFTDKDFLAFLRPNRLNDFTLDALSSIELVTDKAIRETLKQAGLNADEITKPAQSYAPEQPLHRF